MASTNISAATATTIAAWGTTTQTVSDVAGPTFEVWFKYKAVNNERAVGVYAHASTSSNYAPRVTAYSGTADSLTLILTATNVPSLVPTTPGSYVYFKVIQSATGVTPNVALSFYLIQASTGDAPAGSILVNDVTNGFPGAIIDSETGSILGYLPMASGEGGAVLPDCTIALEDSSADDIKIYNGSLAQIATAAIDLDESGQITTNKLDKFFAGGSTIVYRFNKAGTIETSWNIGGGSGSLYGLAVSLDESILYYTQSTGGTTNRPVQRWDLVNNVALSNLAAGIGGTTIRRDVLVMADDSILVPYWPNPSSVYVIRYNTAGVVLNTYTTATSGGSYDHILLDPLHDDQFILADQTTTTRYFYRIRASDGVVLSSFTVPVFGSGVSRDVPNDATTSTFGVSFSCPVFVLGCPVTIPVTSITRTPPVTTPACPCPPGGSTPTTPPPAGTTPIATTPATPPVSTPVPPVEPPETWTPYALCGGGGSVGSYPLADPGESMVGCREDRVWVEAAFQLFRDDSDSSTTTAEVWAVDQTIPYVPSVFSIDNGKLRAAGRVYGLGSITRGMSDDNGNYAGVSFNLRLDDKDRLALRERLGTEGQRYLWDREIRAFIASETNRRTSYATPPRELARCLTKDISLESSFNGSIQCEDRLISQFGAFGPDRSYSSRLLSKGLFPGIATPVEGKPQQWIFGEVSDEGATDPATGEPASKGLVPIWLVGAMGAEDEYHVCCHDICGMSLYGSDGGSPPKRIALTDWRYETMDVTDADTGLVHRVTHVFVPTGSIPSEAHKNGTLTMAANVYGVLGENGLALHNMFYIYQYIFEHLVLPEQESLTGEYVGSPQWADGRYMIDSDSFGFAQIFSGTRMGGIGYQAGFVLGGPGQGAVTLRELLRRMSNSGDCWFTWTAGGQLRVVLLDDARLVDDAQILTEPAMMRSLPTPSFGRDEVENPVLYELDYDDDKQRMRVSPPPVKDDTAITRMGVPKPSPSPIAMRCTRDPATALDVAQRRLLRRKYPPAYYPVVEPLDGLNRNPGDVIKINSIEGIGDGSFERPLWIRETSYDQATRRVTHMCRDLTDILGSAAFAAPDGIPDYDAATDEQQALYAFASDADGLIDGVFAKGAA